MSNNLDLTYLAEKLLKDVEVQITNTVSQEYKYRLNLILSDISSITGQPFNEQLLNELSQKKKGRPPIIKKKPPLILLPTPPSIQSDMTVTLK